MSRPALWRVTLAAGAALAASILVMRVLSRDGAAREQRSVRSIQHGDVKEEAVEEEQEGDGGCSDQDSWVDDGAPLLKSSCMVRVLRPGTVLITGALAPETQIDIARLTMLTGHGRRCGDGAWWENARQSKEEIRTGVVPGRVLNSTVGRGRKYDAVSAYPRSAMLKRLCAEIVQLARESDPAMPKMDPTHLLSLFYAREKPMGWHRDDGRNDGRSEAPVVSVSFGNACEFGLKMEHGDAPETVVLASGDIILFGGPSRHILHTVSKIAAGTCPEGLLELHSREFRSRVPDERVAKRCGTAGYRLNLTFRHAPELEGQEQEHRFFQLGSKGRRHLDTAAGRT
jgi:hypothetical protein